ncbi:hypothetical protein Q4567_15835 [Aliiglaciecola sp. 2_MG-2023]|uniref:hypothetical protein n=1 Tax=unclassified Aliiglaciecola TaxID=2593648 RepID=UPI0026E1C6E2|nr:MULTISPECIES: hypothetical protein [unclassified Aliiglaciecola]MDO6712206.1 hypothetical protein [Aliiglaciecola sp. 2_MG-2023]MDO6753556.1 hypothetical protein [Aliiglaciecola sp. 1_MG-2023]
MTNAAIDTIVLVGTQRSGTTWIMQVLKQETSFNVFGEVFREIRSPEFKGDPALKPDLFYLEYKDKYNDSSSINYVKKVLAEDQKITVFKVMYDQVRRNTGLLKLLASPNVLVINVERKNIFEMALSKCIAYKTGIYHAEKELTYDGFHLKYRTIYSRLWKESIKKRIFPSLIRLFSKNYSYFVYEDLVKDFSILEAEIKGYLNIQSLTLDSSSTKWKKTSKTNKYSAILNFDDITTRLKSSIFKGYVK